MPRQLLLLITLVVLPTALPAALAWQQNEYTARPSITQTSVEASFAFSNPGSTPITITAIKPSCSCTVAKTSQRTYARGEVGTIAVTFHIGFRTGELTKSIVIETDDDAHPRDVLTLHVVLPPQAHFSQRVPIWKVGSPAVAQVIDIDIPKDSGMTVKDVQVVEHVGPDIRAVLTTVVPGRTYQITVTPASTADIGSATIEVVTNLKSYRLYPRIIPTTTTSPMGSTSGKNQVGTVAP
jgi:hypothetical protein